MSSDSNTCIGVIDVETTGLFPWRHDRVVEVAAVVATLDGRIVSEFVSLVNPKRDIGPAHIHGITASDIVDAPTFEEVAPMLLAALQDTVAIAGHNIRFDQTFLEHEFARSGLEWPACNALCTMQLAGGGKLAACCEAYGIELRGSAHSALVDAKATVQLLGHLLAESPAIAQEVRQLPRICWPVVSSSDRQPLTREESKERMDQPPTYLQHLLSKLESAPLPADFNAVSHCYFDLLDRVLEDRQINDDEGQELLNMAMHWGMSLEQVERVHSCYVDRLATAAVADGVVTDAERDDLRQVCRLLGEKRTDLDDILFLAASDFQAPEADAGRPRVAPGTTVCFTGQLLCKYKGKIITRGMAEQLARDAGCEILKGVSKKLGILVVADPTTQSGKAEKAREAGVRIMHERVFWSALNVPVC